MYRYGDVYLFDELLSAIDAHVAQWLFSEFLAALRENSHISDQALKRRGQIEVGGMSS